MQVDDKPMKRCSKSLILSEMQIKITMRDDFPPKKVLLQKQTTAKSQTQVWAKLWSMGNPFLMQPLWNTAGRVLKKWNAELAHDLAISQDAHQNQKQGHYHVHTLVSIAVSVIGAKEQKPSKQPQGMNVQKNITPA